MRESMDQALSDNLPEGWKGSWYMRRDMELVREIMPAIEAKEDLKPRLMTLPDRDPLLVGGHIELLYRAGLVRGAMSETVGQAFAAVFVADLTWDGHEFIAALKNDGVWAKVKGHFTPDVLATVPLSLVKDVSLALAREWVFGAFGLKP